MVVEWPLVHWSHAGCYGQQHGWFYVNDDDDDSAVGESNPVHPTRLAGLLSLFVECF